MPGPGRRPAAPAGAGRQEISHDGSAGELALHGQHLLNDARTLSATPSGDGSGPWASARADELDDHARELGLRAAGQAARLPVAVEDREVGAVRAERGRVVEDDGV